MRSLVRFLSVIAFAALVVPGSAAAAKKPKPAAWAAKHKLKGAWKAKDADRDGLKNLKEFKLGTDPRKADSDRDGLKDGDEVTSANHPLKADSDGDGVKDGAEHAGVVAAFDGETITIRQFNGPKLTAQVDGACSDDEPFAEDSVADEEESIDDGFVETTDDEWIPDFTAEAAAFTGDEETLDLGDEDVTAEDAATDCDIADVEKGDVLRSAEVEKIDGATVVVALEIA
jgi:hypothetical protein